MNVFREDLKFSHDQEGLEMWTRIYHLAFPGHLGASTAREDGQLQRAGIDRTVVLSTGKAVYIDEKVRRKDYGDILIEYVSADSRGTPGWAEKPLFCDFIAYAIIPSEMCYLLPVIQMQQAWAGHKEQWLVAYGTRAAKNAGYNTLNCPVPVDVLFRAIGSCLRVDWGRK